MNVLFLGAKKVGYECLNFLIQNREGLNINIKAVLSNDGRKFENANVKELAIANGIEYLDSLEEILDLQNIDFLISVQYHLILKRRHINVARRLAINLHMAPLPELRGCNQFSFAILNGMSVFGTTLHRLEEGIDCGAIIFERRFNIPENCFVNELVEKTTLESVLLFKNHIGDIFNGNYQLKEQADFIQQRGTEIHFRKEIAEIKKINLNQSASTIIRQIRATAMPGFEFPYAEVNGEKIYLIPEKYLK